MMYPNFRYEKSIWKKGYKIIAGIDEVGRGALAGPVVAGCVVFKCSKTRIPEDIKINDSKQLSIKQREVSDIWIKANSLTWGVGEASAGEIDRMGIVKATNKAMRMAIGKANQRLHDRIQYILIDAFYIPYIRGIRMPHKYQRDKKNLTSKVTRHATLKSHYGRQTAVIKGDEKIYSVAAASIIAKVYRDRLMVKLGNRKKYGQYGWQNNKGYGTKFHRDRIKSLGLSNLHRKTFTEGLNAVK